MRKLSSRAKLALVVLALVVVAVAGYLLLVSPTRGEAARLADETAAVEAQIARYRAEAATGRGGRTSVAELARLTTAMPSDPEMPELIFELNRIARESGIVFKSITPEAASGGQGYRVLRVAVAFRGDFYGLSDFLFRVRNLVRVEDGRLSATGRLFSVETVDLTEGDQKFPRVEALLRIDAFVFDATTPANGAAPPAAGPPVPATEAAGGNG